MKAVGTTFAATAGTTMTPRTNEQAAPRSCTEICPDVSQDESGLQKPETGPLATAWRSTEFLNPIGNGG
jgi:hypothetical protein